MTSPNKVKCNICLDEDVKDPVFTPCIHGFCSECISRWLSEKKDNLHIPCPVCKFDIAVLAGPRDSSQLYDDAPIPQLLLNNAMLDIIRQINTPEPVPTPEYTMRGLGIEELKRSDIPRNLLRQRDNRAIRPVHSISPPVIPQLNMVNFASNMEFLGGLIGELRRELPPPVQQPMHPGESPAQPPAQPPTQPLRRPLKRLLRRPM